jgi:hypothetical protein
MILPFFDQAPLYNAITPRIQANQFPGAWPEATTIIKTVLCPSDAVGIKTTQQGFHGNYLVCHGSSHNGNNNTYAKTDGMFYPLSSVDFGKVKDGTSNTAMFSEIKLSLDSIGADGPGNVECGGSHDLRGRYHNGYHGNITFTTMRPPNTDVGDALQYCNGNPDAPCRVCRSGQQELHARSYHTGGVHIGMADGAVHFVSENIDQGVFQALGSINGRETVSFP